MIFEMFEDSLRDDLVDDRRLTTWSGCYVMKRVSEPQCHGDAVGAVHAKNLLRSAIAGLLATVFVRFARG